MIKKLNILVLIFYLQNLGIAQNSMVDSLQNLLNNRSVKDTARVSLLNDVAYKFSFIDIDKTLKYANEAGKLSDQLNFPIGSTLLLFQLRYWYLIRRLDHTHHTFYYYHRHHKTHTQMDQDLVQLNHLCKILISALSLPLSSYILSIVSLK